MGARVVKPVAGVLGLGRWGSALAAGLMDAGWQVHTWQRADDQSHGQEGLASWVTGCEVVCLAVRDDQLAPLTMSLSAFDWSGKTVIMHSGMTSLHVLEPIAARGARIGKLHPLQSFSAPDAQMPTGIPFAIEGDIDDLVLPWIACWQGQAHHLRGSDWEIYHLAAVLSANFLPLFIREAADILEPLASDQQSALDWLAPLILRSVQQALNANNRQPFSGPAARWDQSVLLRQHTILSDRSPALAELYAKASAIIHTRLTKPGEKGDDSLESND